MDGVTKNRLAGLSNPAIARENRARAQDAANRMVREHAHVKLDEWLTKAFARNGSLEDGEEEVLKLTCGVSGSGPDAENLFALWYEEKSRGQV